MTVVAGAQREHAWHPADTHLHRQLARRCQHKHDWAETRVATHGTNVHHAGQQEAARLAAAREGCVVGGFV